MHEGEIIRICEIKKLVDEYFLLEPGALIEKHAEPLRVFTIRISDHHPHNMFRVYITRRSIKHFVEKRKLELKKRHAEKSCIEAMHFAIEHMKETISNFDTHSFAPSSGHIYSKDYSAKGRPILRVVLEDKQGRLEVKSIHFREKS